jgi:hypothetical protein
LATSGDFLMATCGDFLMATDIMYDQHAPKGTLGRDSNSDALDFPSYASLTGRLPAGDESRVRR